MLRIRGKDTKPELYIRKKMFARGYRYRLHVANIPGHPDIWLKKYNTAVYVNGCFWHRHKNCSHAYTPKSRIDFWNKKFSDNIKRDMKVQSLLSNKGIKCLVIWECTTKRMIRDKETEEKIFQEICSFLQSTNMFMEV